MRVVKPLFLTVLLFAFSIMCAYSQQPLKKYASAWKKVEEHIQKGLPKSALAEVKKIYDLAKKDNEQAHVIRALVYMTTVQEQLREDNHSLSIAELEKEIAISKAPATSILQSILAGRYLNAYHIDRWRLLERTETVSFKKDDIKTWSAGDFHQKISALYLQSIQNTKLLQQTRLDTYDDIIVKGNMRHLRPTLYDLLAHEALNYFQNDERDLQRPAYAFELNQASAFAAAADFVKTRFTTKDSLSLHHKALLVYQELIDFHLRDAKPDALIDVDLDRISFVYAHSVHPDKEKLYLDALTNITQRYRNLPAATQASYLQALYHAQKGARYAPHGDTTHRFSRVKAKEICERVILQKDSSEGKINCQNLLNDLQQKELYFIIEKANVINQPMRAFVKYRNISSLNLRIIPVNATLRKLLEHPYQTDYWSQVTGTTAIKTWQQPLPASNDLQQHGVEIKIDALPAGEYMLLASPDKDFGDKKSLVGARVFSVSNVSYINNGDDYFVLHRDNGQPLANAAVQVWEQKYDYNTSKFTSEKGKLYRADANGFFKMEPRKTDNHARRTFNLEITHDKDRLHMADWYNDYYYRDAKPSTTVTHNTFLFTDRSIYRPGQTIYFKGITLTKNANERTASVSVGYNATIFLKDANYKDVDSIKVTTNEFGSFSGKFQLPQTGLNGQFQLFVKPGNGSTLFRVEEYKRPKFYVDYEPIKGLYRVNDKITVTGIAKAYAGNNIDGATVKYRVVRQPRFLYPWLFRRWWQPPTPEMEIAHGEVKTDKNGKFVIDFTAIPDLTLDKKFEPVFDYRIYADVTDINGETRSGEQMVSVAYKALLLNANIPDRLPLDSLKSLMIRTQNMNGQHEPATVKVEFTRLKEEKRLIRNRYWERPDQFVMSKQEYIGHFPHDEYDNETAYESWDKQQVAFAKSDSSRQSGTWEMNNSSLSPGFYEVTISTTDKNGEPIKDVQYIELYDEKANKLAKPAYLWSEAAKPTEPGETTSVKLGTSADNVFIIRQQDRSTNIQKEENSYSFTTLNDEKRSFDFSPTDADRGGFGAGWIFVKHNRFYSYTQTISVPWSNKQLNIEYATYRDKTLPGSEEKWKVRITGYKKEAAAAEMLAAMYDASLDQFVPHGWSQPSVWPYYYPGARLLWNQSANFSGVQSVNKPVYNEEEYLSVDKRYDVLINSHYQGVYGRGRHMFQHDMNPGVRAESAPVDRLMSATSGLEGEVKGVVANGFGARKQDARIAREMRDEAAAPPAPRDGQPAQPRGDNLPVQVRRNFNETAFFFPDLRTDKDGNIEFSFTMPEALTKWKLMTLAHTKDAAFGSNVKEVVTQKELMVQPNMPRFLREGDKMEFSSKIVNLTDKEITGQAELQLVDATTNTPVDGWFKNTMPNQYFTVAAGQSEAVKFPVEVPYLFNKALVWRIVARAGNYSDGEESALPVLTNRMLVTETLPLNVRGGGTKEFTFDKLLKSEQSETLKHHALTIEYTSNPAWFAVQAMPYLMEYPYECAEQNWNRYYANSLASYIVNASPRIQQVFEQWKIKDTAALMSNLQKNQELKAVLLEETPWVLQAKNENEQKKNIALLFDLVRMTRELHSTYEKLKQMQSSNGGFVWFKGGPDDRYITQYIVTGIGHLKKLKAWAKGQDDNLQAILNTAIPYLDRKIKEEYDELVKHKVDLKKYTPGYTAIQYLYMRSFFPEVKIPAASQVAYNYFRDRAKQTWVQQNKYMQGMIVLALGRTGDAATPAAILRSLKETSINHEELGMYWKDVRSWWWYEAPIERQALLIEAFQEVGKDPETVDDLRTWLLKNKQTNNWSSTKATAEACYALLLQGSDWLVNEPVVHIRLGNITVSSTDNKQEAGTGYFKKVIEGEKINAKMGTVSVTVEPPKTAPGGLSPAGSTSWGAVYWQYFEDLDKITTAATPLKLVKKLFVEKNTDRGPVLTPVNDGDVLKVGDKIKVRVELRVDRDMEYVHMKDMRASGLEPVNVLSTYKWQGGLGYYESTKDASTNFFFSYLRKGTYVFEYPLFVTHAGNFSNGVTSIQCMYAPEFSSHSEGVRIVVE